MLASFHSRGFDSNDCEFLYIDNSGEHNHSAFDAYNKFLLESSGKYIILCHQDILLVDCGRKELDVVLEDLSRIDPQWGLCGNAGAASTGQQSLHITDPGGHRVSGGPFPQRVPSLDENFIVARRSKNLSLSHDIGGFHFYGPDMCAIADLLGCTIYVIDFHLLHKSAGNIDDSFHQSRSIFAAKYRRFVRPRWFPVVTGWSVYISHSKIRIWFARATAIVLQSIRRSLQA